MAISSWLGVLALFAVALWGSSGFGHARYSFLYGAVVWCGALIASQFIGDWAVVVGGVLLGLRWIHLQVRANEERQIFGATMSEMGLMKKSFEYDNPGVPYQAPANRDEMRARVAEFKSRKKLR